MKPRWDWIQIGYVRDPERCQEGHGWQDVQRMALSVRVDSFVSLAK
jgi:hypothetical protein